MGFTNRVVCLAVLALRASGHPLAESEHSLSHSVGGEHSNGLVAPAAPRTTGYGENLYYDYNSGLYPETSYPTDTVAERTGVELEALIAAPLIVTAFSAALFGGLLSPAITYGLNRIGSLEFVQRKRRRKSGKSRSLEEDEEPEFSWISTLETIGNIVEGLRTKRSIGEEYDWDNILTKN